MDWQGPEVLHLHSLRLGPFWPHERCTEPCPKRETAFESRLQTCGTRLHDWILWCTENPGAELSDRHPASRRLLRRLKLLERELEVGSLRENESICELKTILPCGSHSFAYANV